MADKNHPTAQDKLMRGDYVFRGAPRPFSEVFPQIADFRIEAVEQSFGGGGVLTTHAYSPQHLPPEFVNCSNPLCRGGGYPIMETLRAAVREHATSKDDSEFCVGHESMGRRQSRNCRNGVLKVHVDVTYQDAASEPIVSTDDAPTE